MATFHMGKLELFLFSSKVLGIWNYNARFGICTNYASEIIFVFKANVPLYTEKRSKIAFR